MTYKGDKLMSEIVRNTRDIPYYPWYVLSNDTFMSGWGEAEDKINTCVFLAETFEETKKIVNNLRERSEMKYIRTTRNKPRNKQNVLYSVFDHGIPAFYK